MITIDLLRHYWNRSDLLEQLRKVSVNLAQGAVTSGAPPSSSVEESGRSRSRLLRHRFSAEELQAMVDLYRFGAPARAVAGKYGISLRSMKRLLHQRGVRRRGV